MFDRIFPNVFKIINNEKPDINEVTFVEMGEGHTVKFSEKMMRIESKLFREILNRLYVNKKLDAINIHDAIIVLNTSDKKYEPEFIDNVIREVYNENNLFPSTSIDFYNP